MSRAKQPWSNSSSGRPSPPGPGPAPGLSVRPPLAPGQPNMDLTYITERVIGLAFPPDMASAIYRAQVAEASAMFRAKHAHNYKVFNVSQRRLESGGPGRPPPHPHICELGWPEAMAPPLEGLFTLCRAVDAWLQEAPAHVAVLHSRSGRERLGVVVSAYLQYAKVCANTDALDRYAMQRYLDDKVVHLEKPSERRSLDYFCNFLSGPLPTVSSEPLLLNHVMVHGVPAFEPAGGCLAFLRIYEGRLPLFTSLLYEVAPTKRRFTVRMPRRIRLRGGVMVTGYHVRVGQHRTETHRTERVLATREVMFRAYFHTCCVQGEKLVFGREELDMACQDLRFPLDGAVELHFATGSNAEALALVHDDPEPLPPEPSLEPVLRWDSMEQVDVEDDDMDGSPGGPAPDGEVVGHTLGPLDGSLYATVAKQQSRRTVVAATANTPTASMDSGISSAGNGRMRSGGDMAAAHAELDALLHDMLLDIQSIPDLKPAPGRPRTPPAADGPLRRLRLEALEAEGSPQTYRTTTVTTVSPSTVVPNGYLSDDSSAIPYHARADSQPFTYGGLAGPSSAAAATRRELRSTRSPSPQRSTSPPQSSKDGQQAQVGLSSPTLVRKVMRSNMASSSSSPTPMLPRSHSPSPSPVSHAHPAHVAWNTDDELSFEETRSNEGGGGSFVVGGGSVGMTWLQRQQQKLIHRREQQLRSERQPQEFRLLSELKVAQSRLGTTTSTSTTTTTTTTTRSPGEDFVSVQHQHQTSPPVVMNGRGASEPSSPLLPRRSSSRDRAVLYHQQQLQQLQQQQQQQLQQEQLQQQQLQLQQEQLQQQQLQLQQQQQEQLQMTPAGRQLSRQRSDTSFDRERPFVAVRRAHEQARKQQDDPQRLLATSPMGYVTYSTNSTAPEGGGGGGGLLTTVDGQYTMRSETSTTSWERQGWRDGMVVPSATPPTPSFPVHPHTPYANQNSPTPAGLPPRSPTAIRRSYIGVTPAPQIKVIRKWPSSSSISSKERSPSPSSHHTITRVGMSPYAGNYTVEALPPNSYNYTSDSAPSPSPSPAPSYYTGISRRSSFHEMVEVSPAHVKFARDVSRYWYKPHISREEAIAMLRNKPPGTFVVRDSNSFPGAFGLALKVATLPPNVSSKTGDPGDELVRHFLIEPTPKGVRLKGCANEPVFTSLSALVYQHSVTALAFPCKLLLPEDDLSPEILDIRTSTAQQLLAQGAACNVLFLFTMDTESLTGPQAIRKAVGVLFFSRPLPVATPVHFKVSGQGITLTDNQRRLFFRRHYPVAAISFCGLDPEDRRWSQRCEETGMPISSNRVFGFVARKPASPTDNQCHLFAELEPGQPAAAIVNFVAKVMMSSGAHKSSVV